MRQRFFPQTLIISLCLILCMRVSAQAQSTYIPITVQNAAQISQIERIGSGVPRALIFSPDGLRLAVATTLGVWLVDQPVEARHASPVLFEGQGGAESVTFSPDGSKIASGGEDNSVMVFDAATGEAIARLENHIYPVSAVAWAGNYLASGDWSGVVRLWDTSNWSEYRVFSTTERVERLDFGNSLKNLTANFGTQGCKQWSIASGDEVGCVLIAIIESEISARNGEWYAYYLPDTAQIQIEREQAVLTTLEGFYGELGSVFFTPDGRVGPRAARRSAAASRLLPRRRHRLPDRRRHHDRRRHADRPQDPELPDREIKPFVSPARGEMLSCEASVIKPGRKLTVVEAKVYSHEGGARKVVSVALATIAIIDQIPSVA